MNMQRARILIVTFKNNVNQLQIIYEVGIFIIMYIFMLTEGIIRMIECHTRTPYKIAKICQMQ